MTTLQTIQQSIAHELALLDEVMRKQLATSNPLMDKVIDNYLQAKGKLIRPIIVILTAKLFSGVDSKVLAAAASVELLHNASLIHDDIVDQSPTRRGRPTVNAVWDNHIAVLVGDYFVTSSMQQAISTDDVRIIEALCHLGKLLSLGELDQIYNARYHTLTEEAYYRIINYKTASLFVACARMGCYACGIGDHRVETLSRFAELLGMCFQIRDDIFDYFDDEKIGKPTGNDLREGKITLPLLHVLLKLQDEEMIRLSQAETLTDQDIDRLVRYTCTNGGIDYAYDRMNAMRREAVGLLTANFPESEARDNLIELFDYVISRKN
ncbi:MAG: polyprenyl synthetase family protein [Muribaculaceae bacterium]|nr:polyprenyl synthetase family protein [Muribaculaceae bacterium]